MTDFQRGSEWRIWDLHLHTRSSYDYEYNAEDADELLAKAIINNGVAAVAITDHFVIDKNRLVQLRRLAPNVVFFPGVELRTDKGDTNIHVILIFDSDINLDQLVESFNVFKREKGKEVENNDRIYWDYSDIIHFAKQHDALISIHAGSKTNGVDNRITNKLEHNQAVKEEYAKSVHIFEMGKSADIDGYRKYVFPSIGERPLIVCSDNHDPREYKIKAKLWIKADITFNGLKQIIYEPEERICISEIKPELKPEYLVIDKITIHDDDFQTEPILLNPGLNCIIGGKSTGKSILLHNLALTLDKSQTEQKAKTSQTRTKIGLEFDVCWTDGKNDKDGSAAVRKIIYVPQTYLNRLCDDQTEKTEIDEIIQNIVLLNEEASKSYSISNTEIKNHKAELGKTILDLLESHRSVEELAQQMKELGDRSGIEAEIRKLNIEKERLAAESSLTEDEIKAYELASSKVTALNTEIDVINDEISALDLISSLIEPKKISYTFSEHIKACINKVQGEIIAEADMNWGNEKKRLLNGIQEILKYKSDEREQHLGIELSLREKIESNEAIAELSSKIIIESNKLIQFNKIETYKKEKEIEKSDLLNKVVNSIGYFRDQHSFFANEINENTSLKTDELQFSVEVPFKKDAFIEKLKSTMDTRQTTFKNIVSPDDFTEGTYTEAKVRELIEKTITGELTLKKGISIETAIRDILNDWYEVKYKVTMGGDSIDVMSPGKKALVLLKLLIELAESKCPILIDQPEDDLDNRSIFDELIPFIRKKKKERQIIIVTHNANIVIGADADEVIVANQRGKNVPNKERRFEYRSGSIENDRKSANADGSPKDGILNGQGLQQHICDILEGGTRAFELRKFKYHI
jgi:hypothetical protein